MPVTHRLAPGSVDTYHVTAPPGALVFIQSSALSMGLGPIHMRLTGPGGFSIDTCQGYFEFVGRAGDLTLQVSPCSANTGGDYTVTLNIVSDGAGNCGRVVECGATPDGTGFKVPGEVNSFQIQLAANQEATLNVNYLETLRQGDAGAPYLRLFDPEGNPVGEGRCAGTLDVEAKKGGVYTALVSTCGAAEVRAYRIEYFDESCPDGPTVTHFGITDATSAPVPPSGSDAAGRPIYSAEFGQGLSLVLEARAGASKRLPGSNTVAYVVSGTDEDPDLQMILSRALGNGGPAVCDVKPPMLGGVPETVPFTFPSGEELPATERDHIDDLGCRFDDGRGNRQGRRNPLDACTRSNQGFGFSFVDQTSKIQYCAQIATAWEFPDGDTIVAARVKDALGNFGAPREIVVRIGNTPTPTPTASPTPIATRTATRTNTPTRKPTTPSVLPTSTGTRTPTRTRTPSATPTGPTPTVTPTFPPGTGTVTATATPTVDASICAGDCNGSRMVSVDEITLMLNIAFGNADLAQCPAGDANRDGSVAIGDLLQAVTNSLNGCPVAAP